MSNKTPNVKKAKTGSGLRNRYFNLLYLLAGLLLTSSFLLMPGKTIPGGPYPKACFKDTCLKLEDATTPQQRERGLSGRYSIPDNSGMLFVFDEPSKECMWMKDMRFSLDILWINQDRKVVNIASNVTPGTYPQSFCADNTKYVLEVNSGRVSKSGIRVGDSLEL